MAGRTLQTDAFILLRRPPTDAFQGFTVFSALAAGFFALFTTLAGAGFLDFAADLAGWFLAIN